MYKDTTFSEFSIKMRTFSRPAVMGILNVTPDSFYDGGRYVERESVLARAHQIVDEGADILDLGAASTRPGSAYPTEEEEMARLLPALRWVRSELPEVLISVDTCSPAVAERAVEAGADWVNDVGGGSEEMCQAVARLGVPYVLTACELPRLEGDANATVLQRTAYFLSARLERLYSLGASDVMIDPGFGFGKSVEENYALFRAMEDLRMLFPREPLLVGVSRKSMIYKPLQASPQEVLAGSLALNLEALHRGAQILRVHDVKETLQTIAIHQIIHSA